MNLTKFDIGADVISILTKGMYPDPKDAIREYIQNALDANAQSIDVKIRSNSIVVEDTGWGMNHDKLRKAIRLGISEKNPKKDVGFMGIGIYSAFHLCKKLVIHSRGGKDIPNRLTMNFLEMKEVLDHQREKRLTGTITDDELLDLQSLLEKYVSLTTDGEVMSDEFPNRGTRIEMIGLLPEFYEEISNFDHVANYLREVLPLPFSPYFKWYEELEEEITSRCRKRGYAFELVRNLRLQVNTRTEVLYRPYKDSDYGKGKPQAPKIEEILEGDVFYGIMWGCLNSAREKITVKDLRGFLLRKQGFAVGRRENMIKHFPKGNTFFDRYEGEIIVTHPEILPNAARNDLEFSNLRTLFFKQLTEAATEFDRVADEYQEFQKSDEEFAKISSELKQQNAQFNQYREDADKLLLQVKLIGNLIDRISKRKKYYPDKEELVQNIKAQASELLKLVQGRILSISQNVKVSSEDKKKPVQIAKQLEKINEDLPLSEEKNYESLVELFEELDVQLSDFVKKVLFIIDERFIQSVSENRKDYYKILNELKQEISSIEQ